MIKFLIDNALSEVLAQALREAGYDATHVRAHGRHAAADEENFDWAADEDRVIVSADTDFGTLLALRNEPKPSVIIFRRNWHCPSEQVSVLLANLTQLTEFLEDGSIIIFDRKRIRVRALPVNQ